MIFCDFVESALPFCLCLHVCYGATQRRPMPLHGHKKIQCGLFGRVWCAQ